MTPQVPPPDETERALQRAYRSVTTFARLSIACLVLGLLLFLAFPALGGTAERCQHVFTPPPAGVNPRLCHNYASFALIMATARDNGDTLIQGHERMVTSDKTNKVSPDVRTIHAQLLWIVYGHPAIPLDILLHVVEAACDLWRQDSGQFPDNASVTLDVLTQTRVSGP